jgi:hypothetical protein
MFFNGYEYIIRKLAERQYIAICDGWYQTAVQPTPELARMAARIWLSRYGR